MKKYIAIIALAFALALPYTGTSVADPIYEVINDKIRITEHNNEKGETRCVVNEGDKVKRVWGENWESNIYVSLLHPPYEFWKKCQGWIRKNSVVPSNLPN